MAEKEGKDDLTTTKPETAEHVTMDGDRQPPSTVMDITNTPTVSTMQAQQPPAVSVAQAHLPPAVSVVQAHLPPAASSVVQSQAPAPVVSVIPSKPAPPPATMAQSQPVMAQPIGTLTIISQPSVVPGSSTFGVIPQPGRPSTADLGMILQTAKTVTPNLGVVSHPPSAATRNPTIVPQPVASGTPNFGVIPQPATSNTLNLAMILQPAASSTPNFSMMPHTTASGIQNVSVIPHPATSSSANLGIITHSVTAGGPNIGLIPQASASSPLGMILQSPTSGVIPSPSLSTVPNLGLIPQASTTSSPNIGVLHQTTAPNVGVILQPSTTNLNVIPQPSMPSTRNIGVIPQPSTSSAPLGIIAKPNTSSTQNLGLIPVPQPGISSAVNLSMTPKPNPPSTANAGVIPQAGTSSAVNLSRIPQPSSSGAPNVGGTPQPSTSSAPDRPHIGTDQEGGARPQPELSAMAQRKRRLSERSTSQDANGEGPLDLACMDEQEFTWDEYLEDTEAMAAPNTSFKHVEISLQSGFVPGMKLEVANKANPQTYWVATVIMTCGQLLLLRYDGYKNDRSADFWCDITTADVHPIGWCAQNGRMLQPPDVRPTGPTREEDDKKRGLVSMTTIRDKCSDWGEFLVQTLTGARTAPSHLLEGPNKGIMPVDQIRPGMRVEVGEEKEPVALWIAVIMENIGGRLRLRWDGVGNTHTHDFWLFYLSPRLHPVGWAQKHGCYLKPPQVISSLCSNLSEWSTVLQQAVLEASSNPLPPDAFKDQVEVRSHSFQAGMKLEAIDPHAPHTVTPATVTKVFSSNYFLVEMDDLRPERPATRGVVCHAGSQGIFPVGWSNQHGLHLSPPKGFQRPQFEWTEYLRLCNAQAAPETIFNMSVPDHEFEEGMKLEVVNPMNHAEICVASITKVVSRVMLVRLEGAKVTAHTAQNIVVDVESMELFPVGWCETNGYPLSTPPKKAIVKKPKKVAVVQPEKHVGMATAGGQPGPSHSNQSDDARHNGFSASHKYEPGNKYWCPKIYVNHKCFSGPYLNKGRIAELPRSVGPGSVVLVLKEVLTLLINAAYKPSRVLRELQVHGEGREDRHQQQLKAKYMGKSYRAMVEMVRTSAEVESYCKEICHKLECCPNLFGPLEVTEECPENCSILTKTKYTYYYGKRKKGRVGRPPGGHTNLEGGPKKPGKRKKRKKMCFVQRKKRSATTDESAQNSPEGVDQNGSEGSESGESKSPTPEEGQQIPEQAPVPMKRVRRERKEKEFKLPKLLIHERTRRQTAPPRSTYEPYIAPPRPVKPAASPTAQTSQEEDKLRLDSNPLYWSVIEVVKFIKDTDCAPLAKIFLEQEIDGQALLLLTLPTVQECMELKLGPAIKLCHHIERVKIAFYEQFAK